PRGVGGEARRRTARDRRGGLTDPAVIVAVDRQHPRVRGDPRRPAQTQLLATVDGLEPLPPGPQLLESLVELDHVGLVELCDRAIEIQHEREPRCYDSGRLLGLIKRSSSAWWTSSVSGSESSRSSSSSSSPSSARSPTNPV